MKAMVKRNLKLYFRDTSHMFFSVFAALIMVVSYVMFIGPNMVRGMGDHMYAGYLVNRMLLAGVMSVTPVTTAIGTFSLMVWDRKAGRLKDFYVSPIGREKIAGAFIISAGIISFVVTMLTYVLFEGYNYLKFGMLPNPVEILLPAAITLLAGVFSAGLGFLAACFIPTPSGYGSFNSIVGVLIGFANGMYFELKAMEPGVQAVVKLLPTMHIASLLRQVLLEKPLALCFGQLSGNTVLDFKRDFGVILEISGHRVTALESVLFIGVTAAILFAVSAGHAKKPAVGFA